MSQYYGAPPPNQGYGPSSAQNLQFYPSSYSPAGASGHGTPSQAAYGGYPASSSGGYGQPAGFNAGFGPGASGISGRMGEQGGLRTGWIAAFSTEGYDGEPPLLEELGVNFGHIQAKTLAVLNPFRRIDQHLMDDSDLAGPIIVCLLFGFILLLSGRVHFGYIYGLALLGSTSLHVILSLMSPSDTVSSPPSSAHSGVAPGYSSSPAYPNPAANSNTAGVSSSSGGPGGPGSSGGHGHGSHQHLSSTLTMARSASVLGYCMLPLVATSVVGISMAMDTPAGIVMTAAAIMWCTYSASGMFCAVGRMRGMRGLVAYPLALFYVCFGIMGIFSSRGSGASLAKVAEVASKVKVA